MASNEIKMTTKKRLMELLEESPWNVKEVAELFVVPDFFEILEPAFKEDFDETKRFRILTIFSLAPKELLQKYKNEILQIVNISKDRSSKNSSKNWNSFSASLTEYILKNNNTKYDDLLKQESEDILNKSKNVESKFDHSFVPKEYMYMERSELPELIKKCATREIVEKHFVPRENNNNSNSATKRKLVEKPKIQRYDIPYDTINNNNKKQKVMHTTTTTDDNNNNINSNSNNNMMMNNINNNNNNSNTTGSSSNKIQGLQKHYCEQIELYMQNADRAVLTSKRIKIIKDFMANPKDPRYKQRLCAVPLTKKLVEQTDVSLKFELSLFIFNFKAGEWHYKPKKYKKVTRQPQSNIMNPVDVRRGGGRSDSSIGGTPSYYGMSPSPSASPPLRGASSPGFYSGSPPY